MLPSAATRLLLLDIELAPLSPAVFDRMRERLIELAMATHTAGAFAYLPAALLPHAASRGLPADAVEARLPEDIATLALSAAAHIAGGQVKVAREALAKADILPLGGLLDARGDKGDPVHVATVQGISLGLDDDSLRRAA
jgi:hypothetical protein